MKFILLASFALACAASPLYGTGSIAATDGGSYTIASPYGFQVAIQGPRGVSGQRYFQITVGGPNVPVRSFQVSQSSIGPQEGPLAAIFREYQGVIGEPQYRGFLNRVSGVSPQFYQLLQSLNQVYGQQYYGPYAQQYYGSYGQQYGYPYPAYYNQYGSSRYSSPLNYVSGSLTNQQYYGVPQGIFSSYQQYPYGQDSQLPQIEVGVPVENQQYINGIGYQYGQQYGSLPFYLRQWLGQYPYLYNYYQPSFSGYQYNVPQIQLVN